MTTFEQSMLNAQEEDKVVFYDYIRYKKAAGWFTNFSKIDWNRPQKIKKARYDANFLLNLPDYYFLGFPIKELLKSDYSNGRCHACSLALSLCFDDFQIITCNLENYVDYWNEVNPFKITEFIHTVLLVNLDGKKVVIDTTFGLITDIQTYNYIFNIKNIRFIFSEEIKATNIYKYIESKKLIKGPSIKDKKNNSEEYKEYEKEIFKYMELCSTYENKDNIHLKEFLSEYLLDTSNNFSLETLMKKMEFKTENLKFEYPTKNMFSLEDDEFDITLDGEYEETIIRNKKVLENYHKESENQKEENKVLKLINRLFHN